MLAVTLIDKVYIFFKFSCFDLRFLVGWFLVLFCGSFFLFCFFLLFFSEMGNKDIRATDIYNYCRCS